MNAIVEELLAGDKRQTGTADMMLQLAEWAGASYARYDRAAVDRVVKAAAEAAYALAGYDAASGRHLAEDRVAASVVPIFKGRTLGIWITPAELGGEAEELIAREFGP
ncbi:MAG: hypothetical protein F9K43_30200 [Bauldia sp.]|nr:MAG: hypothetical protein F9K43_30200 [Bauldia sp.]